MRVLLIGAGGFIGRHAPATLHAAGHSVQALGRASGFDFQRAERPEAWLPQLDRSDAAIYLPGTMRDRLHGERDLLQRLHHRVPLALGQACVQLGVRRLLHVSALCGGGSAYARSKQAGDAALLALAAGGGLDLHIVRPSLVMGAGGVSSRQFEVLSRLPWLPLPAALQLCRVQPLRVEDLAAALVACLLAPPPTRPWPAVGPEAAPVPEWIARRRAQRGQRPAVISTLPGPLVQMSARLGDHLPFSSWSREALALLAADSIEPDPHEAARLPQLLGRPLRPALEGAW